MVSLPTPYLLIFLSYLPFPIHLLGPFTVGVPKKEKKTLGLFKVTFYK